MVIYEEYDKEARLVRVFSNIGMMIERNGRRYIDVIDREGREYTETDEPIPVQEGEETPTEG